jgi:hypothetical protein
MDTYYQLDKTADDSLYFFPLLLLLWALLLNSCWCLAMESSFLLLLEKSNSHFGCYSLMLLSLSRLFRCKRDVRVVLACLNGDRAKLEKKTQFNKTPADSCCWCRVKNSWLSTEIKKKKDEETAISHDLYQTEKVTSVHDEKGHVVK